MIAHIQLRWAPTASGRTACCSPWPTSSSCSPRKTCIPPHVNKFFYLLAPFLAVALALIAISVIPFGPEIEIFGVKTHDAAHRPQHRRAVHPGALSSLGVYGIALAGWASNNKYSLLGGLRSSAQMISYELPMALAIAAPLLLVEHAELARTSSTRRPATASASSRTGRSSRCRSRRSSASSSS